MEILFQNTQEDIEASYYYWCSETADGKKYINQKFGWSQFLLFIFFLIVFFTPSFAGRYSFVAFFGVASLIIMIAVASIFFGANFKPKEYMAKQFSRNQATSTTPRQLQIILLPNRLLADDDWLEIHSSEQISKYRWNLIDYIGKTSNYIFVQILPNKVISVPKRSFTSEQSFIEFGNKLTELYEKNKNRPVGS